MLSVHKSNLAMLDNGSIHSPNFKNENDSQDRNFRNYLLSNREHIFEVLPIKWPNHDDSPKFDKTPFILLFFVLTGNPLIVR